jgi:nucleoid-associated protein YgaU
VKVNAIGNDVMRGWSDPMLCISEEVVEPIDQVSEIKTYTVKQGDSLWKIAVQFLGNGVKWPYIYRLNSDVIKDPNLITIGMVLKIPSV